MLDCRGEHRYFVAEVVGVPQEGKVYTLIVCTACGDFQAKETKVSVPGAELRLLKEEKRSINKETK